jgi:hypothetical protein
MLCFFQAPSNPTIKGFLLSSFRIQSYSYGARRRNLGTLKNKPFFFCGGSLITKLHVISAAHCVTMRNEDEKP